MVSVSVRYLFYQPVDEKIKTWPLRFPAKEIWGRHCSTGKSCCCMTSNRSISWFLESPRAWSFFTLRLVNQKPRPFVSVQQTNQIALFSFVCCFCFVCAFSFQGCTKIVLLSHNQYIGQTKYKSLRGLKSVFTFVASSYANLLRRKKVLTGGKSSTPTGPIWLPLYWGGTPLWRTWRHVN